MKRLFPLIVIILLSQVSLAQFNADSVAASTKDAKIDTLLVKNYLDLSNHFLSTDSLQSITYLNKAEETADLLKNSLWKGRTFYALGRFQINWGYRVEDAIPYYAQALELFIKNGAIYEELEVILRLGSCYSYLGQDKMSFEVYKEALNRHPDDPKYRVVINNSIGVMMKGIGESETALEYMDESALQYELIENPDVFLIQRQISNYKNRGVLYRNNESYDTAATYFELGLELAEEINDSTWMGSIYNSVGIMYASQQLFLQAIEAYEKSLAIKRSQNYDDGVVTSLTNIGNLYVEMGQFNKAESAFQEGVDIYLNGNTSAERYANLLFGLADLHYKTSRYKSAYEHLDQAIHFQDSLEVIDNAEQKKELEAQYQNEVLLAKEDQLKAELLASNLREEQRDAELQKARTFRILGIAISIIMLMFIIIIIRSNLKRKAVNEELQNKNEEILQKSDEIEFQKHQIEEKNTEIMDSITYAKRIQQAILPNSEFFNSNLPDNFIFYQPKEILAGDFYWMDKIDDTIIWAAADCTGHGIPGAMVSVVCHNALNRSVHEFGYSDPGEILDCTRKLVIETFVKSGMEVKDGMDIALCSYNPQDGFLKFAGANNPLWLVRPTENDKVAETDAVDEDKSYLLRELKGDKLPVGLGYSNQSFTSHKVALQKGDEIYLFTDGFADQFGGDKGKKMKAKNFKKLILSIANHKMRDKELKITQEFNRWKGSLEQLDDVCVIGVRIN